MMGNSFSIDRVKGIELEKIQVNNNEMQSYKMLRSW